MKYILATSKFCGPCQNIKSYIEKNALDIEFKELASEPDFFIRNDIISVPTLVDESGNKTLGTFEIMNILSNL